MPRYRLEDAARYVGFKPYQQGDLHEIPHGRTKAMHYCFAQSDLDVFKASLGTRRKVRPALVVVTDEVHPDARRPLLMREDRSRTDAAAEASV